VTSKRTPPDAPPNASPSAWREGEAPTSTPTQRALDVARALYQRLRAKADTAGDVPPTPVPALAAPGAGHRGRPPRGLKTLGEVLQDAAGLKLPTPPPTSADAPPAVSSPAPSPLAPEEQELLAAHVAVVNARRERQREHDARKKQEKKQARRQERRRRKQLQEAELLEALEARPRGPNLPPYKRRNAGLYVQEEDLEAFIPDGWAKRWEEECQRLGRRIGIPPAAVPMLMILEWCHGLRSASARTTTLTGCGLQASPDFFARKGGVTERWCQELGNRLDPWAAWRRDARTVKVLNSFRARQGQAPLPEPPRPGGGRALVQRFPQLKLYETLTRDLPEGQRLPAWMDNAGKVRRFVDVRGLYYVTFTGCRALRRRAHRNAKPRPGRTPKLRQSPMQAELYQLLRPLYLGLRARLACALPKEFTPKNDSSHDGRLLDLRRWADVRRRKAREG
jgi:hypothetical protein